MTTRSRPGLDTPTNPAGVQGAGSSAGPHLSYIPALDGIRALAVLGVMGYHGGISWLAGGFFGVDAFFVLSGFLITTLLLSAWERRRTIRLGAFWARRARRLLPALLLVVLFVAFYAAVIVPRGTYPNLRLDALSTLFYVGNWHFILIGSNYFNQTGLPSPLTHTWSLAIEEQFYLVWPLIVLGVLKLTRNFRVLLGICVGGAVASAVEMALLYRSADLTRLYYGTDTHAQCLLIGASFAVILAVLAQHRASGGENRSPRVPQGQPTVGESIWSARTPLARTALAGVGFIGLGGSAVLWWRLNGNSALLFRGGFVLAALASLCVIVSAVCAPRSPVARLLSLGPLRFLGRISYGMYLWHYPLFIWIDGSRTGLSGYPLFLVRCLATVAVATASFYLIEQPIRTGTFLRDWRAWAATPVAAAVTIGVLGAATAAPAGAFTGAIGTGPQSPLYTGPSVRVLLEGDSVGLTLGVGLSRAARTYDVTLDNQTLLGCGVVSGAAVELGGVHYPTAYPCNGHSNPQWDQRWQSKINAFAPNVVLVQAGRWEVVNRTYQGRWTNILNPTYATYVKSELMHAVQVATSRGARVVFLTAPCFASGEQPDGQPWPEDQAARLAEYNSLVRQVAVNDPAHVSVVDLYAMVCPGGHYRSSIAGVVVRRSDGVHFTLNGGVYLAPQIWPLVVQVGRAQMALTQSRG